MRGHEKYAKAAVAVGREGLSKNTNFAKCADVYKEYLLTKLYVLSIACGKDTVAQSKDTAML